LSSTHPSQSLLYLKLVDLPQRLGHAVVLNQDIPFKRVLCHRHAPILADPCALILRHREASPVKSASWAEPFPLSVE